jgi:hypothetical protein
MRSKQIKSTNPYVAAVNNKFVEAKEFNELQQDVVDLSPLVNQPFRGTISLNNNLTHYTNWTANSNAEVVLAGDKVIGGSAEIRMIGDGTHTPLFAAFVKSGSSADFDPTLNAKNKVVFYYDGTDAFYSITVLA